MLQPLSTSDARPRRSWRRTVRFAASTAMCAAVLSAVASSSTTRFALTRDSTQIHPDALAGLNAAAAEAWAPHRPTPADDLTVARRLALALTGSIPSLEEIRALEAQPTGERLRRQLDQTLRDGRFHRYFSERLARAMVGVEVQPLIVYRRDFLSAWLAEQLRRNTPYDRMAAELIAGVGTWGDNPAVNFLTVDSDIDTWRGPDKNRVASRVARSFVGVNLDCAECHDHPFASWKKEDYHNFAAFFAGVEQTWKGIIDGPFPADARQPAAPYRSDLLPSEGSPRVRLAKWVTSRENRNFSRTTVNRVWALLCGEPLAAPVDDLPQDDKLPKTLKFLSDDFADHGYDLQRLIRLIVESDAFRAASVASESMTAASKSKAAPPVLFPTTRLRPEQIARSIVQASSLAPVSDARVYPHLRMLDRRLEGTYVAADQFVECFGDNGEKELNAQSLSMRQILQLMNDEFVQQNLDQPWTGSVRQISRLAHDDGAAVEAAYLAVLTRRPTGEESSHFVKRLQDAGGNGRAEALEDLFWALINSAEFVWNH